MNEKWFLLSISEIEKKLKELCANITHVKVYFKEQKLTCSIYVSKKDNIDNYINIYFKATDDDDTIMFGKFISNVRILGVKDANIWINQAYALFNQSDMEEIKENLSKKSIL